MKKFAKVALVLMCAVALVVCSILGTLAYLKSTSDVAHNTFTVGKVAITLDETDVDVYGNKDSENRVLTNEYKLIAGHTYTKDPTVTVAANSEESYIRMVVTIKDIADLKAACGVTGQFMPGDFVDGWDAAKWECVDGKLINDGAAAQYTFNYTETVDTLDGNAKVLEALFESFTLPATATNDQVTALEELEIDVIAYAMQADGFGTAAEAWAAFN